jgi:hypothetical protein
VSDALAPVKKKSAAGHCHTSSKQQAASTHAGRIDCSMGMLGFFGADITYL